MTIRRTFDAAFLNKVANHAEVRPWLGSDRASVIDMTALVSNPENVALVSEHGGFVFVQIHPNVFEVHTQFLPSGRGYAQDAAREAAEYMFEIIGADALLTDVPEDNAPALVLAIKTGFSVMQKRFDTGGVLSGKEQEITELSLTKERYLEASASWRDGIIKAGNGSAECRLQQ